MSAITDQIHQLHDEVAVLTKLRRVTLAQAIFAQVAHSNIQTLVIRVMTDELGREVVMTTTSLDKMTPADAAFEKEDFIFHAEDGQEFNLNEHGNAGLADYLKSGIEWDAMTAILDEINQWRYDLEVVFDLEVNGQAVFITADQHWTADVVYAEPEEKAAD